MRRFRIIHNDTGEPLELASIDLSAAEAQGVIARRMREFQADSLEPYAPNGLSVVEVFYDEDEQRVVLEPLDWREFYYDHDPRAERTN